MEERLRMTRFFFFFLRRLFFNPIVLRVTANNPNMFLSKKKKILSSWPLLRGFYTARQTVTNAYKLPAMRCAFSVFSQRRVHEYAKTGCFQMARPSLEGRGPPTTKRRPSTDETVFRVFDVKQNAHGPP